MSQSTTNFSDWIGRREEASDVATLSSVAGMIATLDRDDGAPQIGDPLPPLWHWMYFAPRERHSGIGPDGHPRRGGFMPPILLPRRMFAGGRATFHAPIRIGDEVRREGEIKGVTRKDGRTGELVFVTVGYRILTDRGLAIEEEHDIVYRDAPTPGQQAASQAPVKAVLRRGVVKRVSEIASKWGRFRDTGVRLRRGSRRPEFPPGQRRPLQPAVGDWKSRRRFRASDGFRSLPVSSTSIRCGRRS